VNESTTNSTDKDIRQQLREIITHLEHVLPGQAPIRDFVHHNTLHGYQHLHFADALKAAHELTGTYGYLAEDQYREFFKQGRISLADLSRVLADDSKLNARQTIASEPPLRQMDIYLTTLLHPLKTVTGCQLNWEIEEQDVLSRFQPDVTDASRTKLLSAAAQQGEMSESSAISSLWSSCLKSLNLEHFALHPEDMVELDPERAEDILKQFPEEDISPTESSFLHKQVHRETKNTLGQMLRKVGHEITLGGFLKTLTGEDILDEIRPTLQKHMASFLDQGMAAWHNTERQRGFYASWRASAGQDLSWVFEQMPEWNDTIETLPDDALETIIFELRQLGIAQTHWTHYLERLALELPGWSGMFLWRHQHPGYEGARYPVDMLDYLAVRLVLERLFAQRLCREHWQLEANLDMFRWYFRRRRSEFYCRYQLFNTHLPEYLISLIQQQMQRSRHSNADYLPWKHIADMVITWKQSPMAARNKGYSVLHHGWQLFRLAQHLGLCGAQVAALNATQIEQVFQCMETLDNETKGFIWLQAYERNYRDALFNAVLKNESRGRWKHTAQRPQAQVIFCMDDREEAIRRHLEEYNPMIETLGAAGFFGVAINWRGLDDETVTPLCPVVVTPVHELRELANEDQQDRLARHSRRRRLRLWLKNTIHQETRRSTLTPLLVCLSAPLGLLGLLGKTFSHRATGQLVNRLAQRFDQTVQTHVAVNAESCDHAPSIQHNQLGFTDKEQADRVENFLRTVGLNKPLAPFVVMMGHGSSSSNNPHLAAYDCGACSGRHGGPNARIFARIANRPEIRTLLKARGISIADDTWFLGAEHNTCDESITWYDTEAIPADRQSAFTALKTELDYAATRSAHERCRRLASAPRRPSLKAAIRHIIGRAHDFSQARPELGHATNAAAFIGRRSLSQGAFFDRRVFLISYDPTQDDDEGHIIENILLNAGPVGAGINLEYYFSTINNDEYGSGSKVTHNVTGLFAVMDGTDSDLRTGLPRQMIEIHEAMRLQVLVEASTEVLTKIYLRQPALQELVGNGWLLLSAKDPDSATISVFVPGEGFVPWQGEAGELPMVASSSDWYDGHHLPLSPALIKQPEVALDA